MSDDAGGFGPRLYGLFDGADDEQRPAEDDHGEDEGPPLDEILDQMRLNVLSDPEGDNGPATVMVTGPCSPAQGAAAEVDVLGDLVEGAGPAPRWLTTLRSGPSALPGPFPPHHADPFGRAPGRSRRQPP